MRNMNQPITYFQGFQLLLLGLWLGDVGKLAGEPLWVPLLPTIIVFGVAGVLYAIAFTLKWLARRGESTEEKNIRKAREAFAQMSGREQ